MKQGGTVPREAGSPCKFMIFFVDLQGLFLCPSKSGSAGRSGVMEEARMVWDGDESQDEEDLRILEEEI